MHGMTGSAALWRIRSTETGAIVLLRLIHRRARDGDGLEFTNSLGRESFIVVPYLVHDRDCFHSSTQRVVLVHVESTYEPITYFLRTHDRRDPRGGCFPIAVVVMLPKRVL